MTEVYSKNELEAIAKSRKNTIFAAIAFPSFALVLAVVLCFLADSNSLSVYKAIGCTVSVLCVWISVYLVWNRLPKLMDNAHHISRMLTGDRTCLSCVVSRVDAPKTLTENILAYEIFIKDEDAAFYYEQRSGEPPFATGDQINIRVVNNYIVAYEVKR